MYHKSTGQEADARKEMYFYLIRKYGYDRVDKHKEMIKNIKDCLILKIQGGVNHA